MRKQRMTHSDPARQAMRQAAKQEFRVGFFGGLAVSLLCVLILLAARLGF